MPFSFQPKTSKAFSGPYIHRTTSEATLVDSSGITPGKLNGNAKSEKLPQTSKPDSLGFDTIDRRRNWEALAFAGMNR
ncbi:hypothetical protein ACCO45_006174 [Purpureocillium lilacinum]|uniref:Uncharacterized protein n=1 Tax=Purpureocillium lilacinum TaxID=33203 RepID=A0ACC4DXH1_PURLI